MAGDLRLQQISIASPCGESWNSMRGDERVRHCDRCDLNVYNFASMTAREVTALLDSTGGRLCGRIFRRTDGTILLRDCPVGLAAIRKRVMKFAAMAGALLLSTVAGIASAAFSRRGADEASWDLGRSLYDLKPFQALARWTGNDDAAQGRWIAGDICIPVPPISNENSLLFEG